MVKGSSEKPLNVLHIIANNRAPMKSPPSCSFLVCILVLKNMVAATEATINSWMALKTYTKECLFIKSHSLSKLAFRSSVVEMEYFLFTRAALWCWLLSYTCASSFSSCCLTWNPLNLFANSLTGMYLYGLLLSAQYCSWSFLDVNYFERILW